MAGNAPSGSSPDRVKASVWQMPVALDLDQHLAIPRALQVHRLDDRGWPAAKATAARVFIGFSAEVKAWPDYRSPARGSPPDFRIAAILLS
jgi:hypothetical protein